MSCANSNKKNVPGSEESMKRRVVVTGMGGSDLSIGQYCAGVLEKYPGEKVGIGEITRFDTTDYIK